jgi:hypothetical protein
MYKDLNQTFVLLEGLMRRNFQKIPPRSLQPIIVSWRLSLLGLSEGSFKEKRRKR